MLSTFSAIKGNFKFTPPTIVIDNWSFRAHYWFTSLTLLVATVLVTSRQYIGDHINCISDSGVPENVMNTFCFFTTTFTVIKDYDDDMVASGNVPHPGVGPYSFNSTVPIRRHAYYQWVPFVLFAQAIMFHCTHLLWKHLEGGRIRRLIAGFQLANFAFLEKELIITGKTVPSKKKKEEYIQAVREDFRSHLIVNKTWSRGLILCEILNVFNVVLQIFITNAFLDGQFYSLGVKVIEEGFNTPVTALDEVFPKVTKCTFHKYGPSGSIQSHDAMCVMALNVINEKIYVFFWFWYFFLFIISCLALLWRGFTLFFHARSSDFNRFIFIASYPDIHVNPYGKFTQVTQGHFSDWLFLRYISKNMDAIVFKELFDNLVNEEEQLLLIDDEIEEHRHDTNN